MARRAADPTVAAALARDDDVAAAEPAVSATPSIATNDLAALRDLWYQVAAAPPDDEDAQRTRRQIEAKVRRLCAGENCKIVHPDEPLVEMFVPLPLGVGSSKGEPQFFTIRNSRTTRSYHGRVLVPRCVSQKLAHMIAVNREVDARRMKDVGRTVDLDNPIAARAKIIAATE